MSTLQKLTTDTNFTKYPTMPVMWHGGLVTQYDFQVGYEGSNPSTLTIQLIDDVKNSSVFADDLVIGSIVSFPVGEYDWYGVVKAVDRTWVTRTPASASIIGTRSYTITLESVRGSLNSVCCILSNAGDHLPGTIFDSSGYVLNVYEKMAGDEVYDNYYIWREGFGMPWYIFKKTMEKSTATFKIKGSTIRLVWQIPSNSNLTDTHWYINLWCNTEFDGLGNIIDAYLSQYQATWVDELVESEEDGIDYDLNVWVIDHSTDTLLSQEKVATLINTSDATYETTKINSVHTITWGEEARADACRNTLLGGNVEFSLKYDITNDGTIKIPGTEDDVLDLYDADEGTVHVIPFFGWADSFGYGPQVSVIAGNNSTSTVRRIATQPFITYYESPSSVFYFSGCLQVDSISANHMSPWQPESESLDPGAAADICAVDGEMRVDPCIYSQFIKKTSQSEADWLAQMTAVLKPSYDGTWDFDPIYNNATVPSILTLQSIWEYVYEPLDGFLFSGILSIAGNVTTIGGCRQIVNKTLPDATLRGLVEVLSNDFQDSLDSYKNTESISIQSTLPNGSSVNIESVSVLDLKTFFNRLKHVTAEFNKLSETFLQKWIVISPQNIKLQRTAYRTSEMSTTPSIGNSVEIIRAEAANSAWGWSEVNNAWQAPVFGVTPSYNMSSVLSPDWKAQHILWSTIDPESMKIGPVSVTQCYYDKISLLQNPEPLTIQRYGDGLYTGSPISIDEQFEIVVEYEDPVIEAVSQVNNNPAIQSMYASVISIGDCAWQARYKICPTLLYMTFNCKDVYYGPITNASSAEESANSIPLEFKQDKSLVPWNFFGEVPMYAEFQRYLNRQKSNLTALTRMQVSANDYFRKITDDTEKTHLIPGVNVHELADTALTNISASYGSGGWSLVLSFASQARNKGTRDQILLSTKQTVSNVLRDRKAESATEQKRIDDLLTTYLVNTEKRKERRARIVTDDKPERKRGKIVVARLEKE